MGRGELQNYGSEREAKKYEVFLFSESNRISETSSSIMVSGIGDSIPGYEQEKDGNLTNANQSSGGKIRTIKKNEAPYEESVSGNSKEDDFTLKSLAINPHKIYSSPNTYKKILSEPNSQQ